MHHKLCSSLYGIVTNVLFMDSGFEDKQNRVLVMTRKGIYMYIVYLMFVDLLPIFVSCMNCFILLY